MREENPVILDDDPDINDPFQVVEAILDLSRHVYAMNYVGNKTKAMQHIHNDVDELLDFVEQVTNDRAARIRFEGATGVQWRGIKKILSYIRNILAGDHSCVTIIANGLMSIMAGGMVGEEMDVELP